MVVTAKGRIMNFLLGVTVALVCTIIQCAIIASLRVVVRKFQLHENLRNDVIHETILLFGIVFTLLCAMFLQAGLWAGVFILIGEVQGVTKAMYFSLVNFTTLGYGDVLLSEEHAILGPIEASNGVLMMGLATSFLFSVLGSLKRG